MSRITLEKPFALIMKNGTIRMSDKTQTEYYWMDVEYIMKDVTIHISDDHIMSIEGVKAEKHYEQSI